MRILLSNYDMNYRGGTQVWVREFWQELSANNEVHLYDVLGNSLWPEIPRYSPGASYDIALMNHWPTFRDLRRADIGVRIFTVHGLASRLELPPLGADAYVSVSEAVRRYIPFDSRVILNPIDTDYFRSLRPVNPELRRVAFVSNRQGRARAIVEEACDMLGVDLRIVGGDSATTDVREAFNWADLVIAVARTALEAMSCERNVICFDWLGGAGPVTLNTVTRLSLENFGGHIDPARAAWYSPQQLASLMSCYDPSLSLRPYVLENHSRSLVVGRYLSLAEEVSQNGSLVGRSFRSIVKKGPRQLTSVEITRRIIETRDTLSRRLNPIGSNKSVA